MTRVRPFHIFVQKKIIANGSDQFDKVVRNPEEAFEFIKELNGNFDVIITLEADKYVLKKTLLLSSLTVNSLTIRSANNTPATLTLEENIHQWEKLEEKLPGLQKAAEGNIWKAKISQVRNRSDLYFSGRRLEKSVTNLLSWKNWPKGKLSSRESLKINEEVDFGTSEWAENAELNFMPTPYTFWSNALTPVKSYDPFKKEIFFKEIYLHPLKLLNEIPYRIENVISCLTGPGNWFADFNSGALYLWPPDAKDPNDAEIGWGRENSCLEIKGEPSSILKNIFIENIEFTKTARLADFEPGEMIFDCPDHAITVEYAENISFKNCIFSDLSGNAIYWGQNLKNCSLEGSQFYRLGGSALIVEGGLTTESNLSSGHVIENNKISQCGQVFWHSPAINIKLSSHCLVLSNEIFDLPYCGIMIGGLRHKWFANWPSPNPKLEKAWKVYSDKEPTILEVKALIPGYNKVQENYLHDVMQVLDDGSAIYCHASHNNVISKNIIHDVYGENSCGIYYDDEEMNSIMFRNILVRAPGEVNKLGMGASILMHNNLKNEARENLVVSTNAPYSFPRSYGGHIITQNYFVLLNPIKRTSLPVVSNDPWDGRREESLNAGISVLNENHYIALDPLHKDGVKEFHEWLQKELFEDTSKQEVHSFQVIKTFVQDHFEQKHKFWNQLKRCLNDFREII